MTTVACKLAKRLQPCPNPFKTTSLHCDPLILDVHPRNPHSTQISIFYFLTYRAVESLDWLCIYAQIHFLPLKYCFLCLYFIFQTL